MMRPLIIHAIISLAFAGGVNAQYGESYTWINPLPQGNHLNAVCFSASNTVYAAGERGTIIKSTNAGETWDLLQQYTFQDLNGVFFLDSDLGFAAGDSGTVLRTSNGGISWVNVSIEGQEQLLDVFLIDEHTGISCGSNGNIFRTEDSGQKWTVISSGVDTWLNAIDFPTPDTGFIVGGGGNAGNHGFILRTNNKGKTWNIIDTLPEKLYAIDCLDAQTSYISGHRGFIARTDDGGMNWEMQQAPLLSYRINDIHFVHEHLGFCSSSYGVVFKTENGGETWTESDNPSNNVLYDISSDQNNTAVFVGYYGTIMQSTDGGQGYTMRSEGAEGDMYMFNYHENKLSAIGAGAMLITFDFGQHWETDVNSELMYCYDFQLLNPTTAYALDYENVYKTTNGGDSWSICGYVPSEKNNTEGGYSVITGLHMVSEQKGFIYGGGQSPGGCLWSDLYKTTDGSHFYAVDFPGGEPITDGRFIDDQIGFMLCGNLFRTENGGNNWTEILLPRSKETRYNSIYFYDDKVGFLLGYNFYNYTIILKTVNGGLNWEITYEGNYHDFWPTEAFFSSPDTGYILGGNGSILKTHDGGKNWTLNKTITGNALNSIFPVTDSSGYLIGSGGTLIAYGEPNLSIPNEPVTEVPYIILYPNPARDKFEVRSSEFGVEKVEIYDLQGRKMIKEHFPPGIKHVEVRVEELKTGAYLCKISIKNHVIIKKILIQ